MEGYMALTIPILGILLGFFGVWTHHKQKLAKLEVEAARASVSTGPQNSEIRDLRERVKVLERIVTDGGYDVAAKIEALRDQRPVSPPIEARTETERLS